MNKALSNKISLINLCMTVLIVLLHATSVLPHTEGERYWCELIRCVGDMAVPTFFWISALLLFKDDTCYALKIKKRVKTLVIPYFLWSVLFYLFFLTASYTPLIKDFLNSTRITFSLENLLENLFLNKSVPQLWYLRILFYIVLISIFWDFLMRKKLKKTTFFIIVTLFCVNFISKNQSTINIITWLPLFFCGAWLSFFYKEKFYGFFNLNKPSISVIAFLVFVILLSFIITYPVYSKIYYFWRMISPLLITFIFSSIKVNNSLVLLMNKYSFFVFCTHYFVLNIFKEIIFALFNINERFLPMVYVLLVISTLVVCILIATVFKRISPKIYSLFCGNRI